MIPEEIQAYCNAHTSDEPEVLARLNRETNLTQAYPRMLAGHGQGTLLRMVSAMLKPQQVLEIGTFTGYSAICFAFGRPGTQVHTIEVNPEQEDIIRRYLKDSGLENNVTLHIGSALEVVPTLDYAWDLVYIDADKENYLNYYRMVLPRVRPGGFILADNALWSGKVLDEGSSDIDTLGIREFNDFVQRDEQVENLLLPYRDGIMVIRKR